tara:strand:+ start:4174 stop:7902 length:3729 start_codon:yes stop_codon:yes gene_type:complete
MTLIRVAADIGGTFTDIALDTPSGLYTSKVLTTAQEPAIGVLRGIEEVLNEAGLKASDIDVFVHGTTLATNALIERRGAVTALLTTEGLRDSVEMAHENRFEQYDLAMTRPEPLVPRDLRFGIPERLDSTGRALKDLDTAALRTAVHTMKQKDVESVAIGFLHSYANSSHEQRAAEIVQDLWPEVSITLSSEVCPEIREYERLSTACANAYIQPLVTRYLRDLESRRHALEMSCPMLLMQSGGGLGTLEDALRFPVRLVESGPAGGALLSAELARSFQLEKALSFDMGGTTAKLCIINDGYPRTSREFEVGREYRFLAGSGLPLRLPVIEMVEIGAGGSSIARLDELGRIAVGPTSAGSEPGPACYGRGGEAPTVTDADVALGRILPDGFGKTELKFSKKAAFSAINDTMLDAETQDPTLAALGVVETVDENMASAGRVHAIEQGCDITDGTLIAFGGAAPLHAARVAEKLGISDVIVPNGAGVGSAIGFLHAPASHENVRTRYLHLDSLNVDELITMLEEMLAESEGIVRRAAPHEDLLRSAKAFMRYAGQGHEITVHLDLDEILCNPSPDAAHLQKILEEAFVEEYRRLYGREITGLGVETLSWVATVSSPTKTSNFENSEIPKHKLETQVTTLAADTSTGEMTATSVVARTELSNAYVVGPALVTESQTTTFVPASYSAWLTASGHLRMRGQQAGFSESPSETSTALKSLHRDIMWNRLIAVVQEQATTLVRSAFSTSTREAGDLSAGVFDPQGRMLAQSITGTPGHVNSMAASVSHFLDEFPVQTMRPGDIYLTNDPWKGTGHLFDVVVVTPVFRQSHVIALFACTSHVVDIGGVGFSSASSEIFHEGLQLPIMRFATNEVFDPNVVKIIEGNVRDGVQVMGDIYSLAACNRVGALRLTEMMDEYQLTDLDDLGQYIIETSRLAMLKEIQALPEGTWRASMRVDGVDEPLDIVTELEITYEGIKVRFDGTSPVQPHGINVPMSYTDAYTSFGVRCIVGPNIPNNAGSLEVVAVSAPSGCILNAPHPAAVNIRHVMGQMLPDAVYGCLAQVIPDKVPAEGTSSLWNLLASGMWDDDRTANFMMMSFNSGGAGARPGQDGLSATAFPSGVRNMPVEINEVVSPLIFWRKEFRPDSGGDGEFRGGLGQVVELGHRNDGEFLFSATYERVQHPARGRHGGSDGLPGRLSLDDGTPVPAKGNTLVPGGRHLIVEFPGGGGLGKPEQRMEEARLRDRRLGYVTS